MVQRIIGQRVNSLHISSYKATTSTRTSRILHRTAYFNYPLDNPLSLQTPEFLTKSHILKMTFLNAALHFTNFRNPFLRTLIPSISAAFALQGAVAIPSILAQSEQFYDLSGSLTYLSVTALSLYLPALRARAAAAAAGTIKPAWPSIIAALNGSASASGLNWRQVVLSAAVSIWATRRKFSMKFSPNSNSSY